MSDEKDADFTFRQPIYSRALRADGALTWDLPPRITEKSPVGERWPFEHISQCFQECLADESNRHFSSLATQLLEGIGLEHVTEWVPVVVRISEQLTGIMSTKKANERRLLLSRNGLKIELLPEDGTPNDSCVIPGVVLRRNIAHRRMRTQINLPKILLLSGALELECNKLTQLHTVISKEPEYVDAAVDKILAVAPDVCVLERGASLNAVQRLQKSNVTLIYNIPMTDMSNLAINTGTKIVENILDVDESCLGTCSKFYILRVKFPKSQRHSKGRQPSPLMVFEANFEKASSAVVLRGGTESELLSVQKVLSFAVFAAYRLHFENAFLTDALSNATAATASFGVEGLPEIGNLECLKQVCKDAVHHSACRTNLKRQIDDCVDAVSPHVTSWTTSRSHAAFEQISEYRRPVYAPCELSCTKLEVQSDGDELSVSALSTSSSMSASNSLNDPGSDSRAEEETSEKTITSVQIEGFTHRSREMGQDEITGHGNVHYAESEEVSDSFGRGHSYDVNGQHRMALPLGMKHINENREEKDTKSNFLEEAAELMMNRSSWDSISFSAAQAQGSYPSAWTDWSDVELLRGNRSLFDVRDEQLNEEYSPPEQARKKMRVMENLRFSASFANRNHRLGLLCEPCHVRSIDSLSDDDLSLMEFLMSIAADAPRRCPAGCGGGNSSHHRTFLHGAVRLTISVVSLPIERSYPNPTTDVWFWARPKGVAAEPMPTVCQMLLSEDAKCLSLGQFLQLMCNTPELKIFGRLLFLEHVIYFGYGRTVACVYGDRIRLKPILTPSPIINYSVATQVNWLMTSADQLIQEVNFVYDAIQRSCVPSQNPSSENSTNKSPWQMARELYVRSCLIPDLIEEKEKFSEEVKGFTDGINGERTTIDQVLEKYLQLNQMWRQLSINVLSWSAMMNDPQTAANQSIDHPFEDIRLSIGTRISDSLVEISSGGEFLLSTRSKRQISQRFSEGIQTQSLQQQRTLLKQRVARSEHGNGSQRLPPEQWNAELTEATPQAELSDDIPPMETPFTAFVDQPFPPSPFVDPDDEIEWGKDNTPQTNEPDLKIEALPPSSESADLARSPSITPILSDGEAHVKLKQNSSAGNLMHLMDREARQFMEENTEDFFTFRQRSVSLPASPRENRLLNQLERRLNFVLDDEEFGMTSESGEGDDALTTPSNIHSLSVRSPHLRPLTPASKTPLPGTEIRLSCRALIPLGNEDLVIPVFEAEPASIIAYVLSSISYHKDLQQSFESLASHAAHNRSRTADSSGDLDYTASESSSSRLSTITDVRGNRSKSTNQMHIFQRFEDSPPGMISSHAKFEVISYFAPQFTKMRARCINGGERSFVMSMSRSRRWKASGGKSNAYFAKTLDDRYIIKSLSKAEKVFFLDKFGSCYFNYMEGQHFRKQNVALAKVLGLFQVSMKSFSSKMTRTEKMDTGSDSEDLGRDWVMDLIVLENVFYDRECSSIYDLKGSHRCRYNKDAEKDGDQRGVFLDTNLRKHNLLAPPLLIDQNSFNQLAETLRRDTDFLVSNSIMDYSLLVGVDSESNCLVVGIIDYIRQYTWDKRLESWVKSSGIMGDGNEEPTIISPDSYRKRFITTILGYFTVVPYK